MLDFIALGWLAAVDCGDYLFAIIFPVHLFDQFLNHVIVASDSFGLYSAPVV
jgi:hypothetical protein